MSAAAGNNTASITSNMRDRSDQRRIGFHIGFPYQRWKDNSND
jgi:hypothetical protein